MSSSAAAMRTPLGFFMWGRLLFPSPAPHLECATLCCSTAPALRHAVLRHAVLRHAMLRHAVLRHAVLFHAVLCQAVLCHAVLHHSATPCSAAFRRATLRHAVQRCASPRLMDYAALWSRGPLSQGLATLLGCTCAQAVHWRLRPREMTLCCDDSTSLLKKFLGGCGLMWGSLGAI